MHISAMLSRTASVDRFPHHTEVTVCASNSRQLRGGGAQSQAPRRALGAPELEPPAGLSSASVSTPVSAPGSPCSPPSTSAAVEAAVEASLAARVSWRLFISSLAASIVYAASTSWRMTARNRLITKKPPSTTISTKKMHADGEKADISAYMASVHVSNVIVCKITMHATPMLSKLINPAKGACAK